MQFESQFVSYAEMDFKTLFFMFYFWCQLLTLVSTSKISTLCYLPANFLRAWGVK